MTDVWKEAEELLAKWDDEAGHLGHDDMGGYAFDGMSIISRLLEWNRKRLEQPVVWALALHREPRPNLPHSGTFYPGDDRPIKVWESREDVLEYMRFNNYPAGGWATPVQLRPEGTYRKDLP